MHILLVFKESRQAQLLAKGLRYENIASDIAHNEDEGTEKLLKRSYDAVLIKQNGECINAIQFCKKTRNIYQYLPIFIYDPTFNEKRHTEAIHAGATAILTAPLSFEALTKALKEIKEMKMTKKENTLKTKNIILDLNTRQVKREKKSFILKNKEFSLLELLIRNKGSILSRPTILEYAWDHNTNILTNTVDVHVSKLRKKIDTGFTKKLIETVHCVGYRLNE